MSLSASSVALRVGTAALLGMGAVSLAACGGGGGGASSNQSACQQVQHTVQMLGAKHPQAKSIQTALADASHAAEGAADPHLRQLGSNLHAVLSAPPAARGSVNFGVAGALSALKDACQPFLK